MLMVSGMVRMSLSPGLPYKSKTNAGVRWWGFDDDSSLPEQALRLGFGNHGVNPIFTLPKGLKYSSLGR